MMRSRWKGVSRTIRNTHVVSAQTLAIRPMVKEVLVDHAPTFAQQLKQRRKSLDLTQRQLANRVGCATVTIQRIEQGSLRPSNQIVQRLAAIFDLAIDEPT